MQPRAALSAAWRQGAPGGVGFAGVLALLGMVPEIVLHDGRLITTVLDTRIFAALAAAANFYAADFYWRRGVLGTIITGMAMLLPLRLGLGW